MDDLFKLANWPDVGDIDGAEFQEIMVKHGWLIPVTVYAPCDPENCNCARFYYDVDEFKRGIVCYRRQAM